MQSNKVKIYGLLKNDIFIYVGSTSSKWMSDAICRHRTDMTKYEYNTNKTKGKDFDDYKIIGYTNIDDRYKTERYWMKYYNTIENGLNKSYPFDDSEFIDLYNDGFNDRRISEILEVNNCSIYYRRTKLGLEPHRKHQKKI